MSSIYCLMFAMVALASVSEGIKLPGIRFPGGSSATEAPSTGRGHTLPRLPSLPDIRNVLPGRSTSTEPPTTGGGHTLPKIPPLSDIRNILPGGSGNTEAPSTGGGHTLPRIPPLPGSGGSIHHPNLSNIMPSLPNATSIFNLKPNISILHPSTWADKLPSADNLVGENLNRVQGKFKDLDADMREKLSSIYQNAPKTILEDSLLTVPDIVQKNGYVCETHTVETEDGYILTMHRIPFGRNGPSEDKLPVVFLQHGIESSSADWIILGVDKSLAYLLADDGYDVWMGNARGNTYSRKHKTLDSDDNEFWNFCWNNIAMYDMPAMIDYALQATEQEKLFYVGHSQGTTVFYVLCSEKPEYNEKFYAHFSLAPIAYMNHVKSPMLRLLAPTAGVSEILPLIGVNEFSPNSAMMREAGKLLCSDDSVTQVLCANTVFVLSGFNRKQMNETLLPTIMAHTPAGSSTKQYLHYAQEVNSGKFAQYDFGPVKNLRLYKSMTAPEYPVEKITAPMYLFYSRNDWLSHETDVARLYERLNEPKELILVEDAEFNHVDYLYAINVREQVNDRLISIIKSLDPLAHRH